ncbi:hypothetical protein [Agrobacterium vitis]|nr:hypothetical protein [Agrobacterium vitis]
MLSQKNMDAFEVIYISGVKIAMEVGSVRRVRFILEEWSSFVEQANVEIWTDTFKKAKYWLAKSIQYEKIHGEGSFFNPEHPHIKSIRAYRQQYHMPGDGTTSSANSSASAMDSLSGESTALDHEPDTQAA